MAPTLKIGEVAALTGVSVQTLRLYERWGLIPPATRNMVGYRHYPSKIVGEVRLIKLIQALGFSLKEVQQLLPTFRNPKPVLVEAAKQRFQHRLSEVDRQMAYLKGVKKILKRLIEMDGQPEVQSGFENVLASIMHLLEWDGSSPGSVLERGNLGSAGPKEGKLHGKGEAGSPAEEDPETRFHALAESLNLIPWELDGETGCYTYVGPHAERILGFPVEAWRDKNFWYQKVHPEDRDWVSATREERVANGIGYGLEYRMIAADGRTLRILDLMSGAVDGSSPRKFQGLFVAIEGEA